MAEAGQIDPALCLFLPFIDFLTLLLDDEVALGQFIADLVVLVSECF